MNGATLTITDDDVAPGDIGLTLSSSAVAESASATTITVTAALGGSTRFTTDKAITVAVGASGDGATEGTDYGTVSDFTITLSAGSGSVTGTFSVDPTQDVLDEGTGESVSVSGSTSANDTVNGATLTITDDDVAPGDIGLTLSSSAVAESASATTITVTAALGGCTRFTTDKAITVAVGASGDGATEGTDYGTVSDFTITLSAGSGSVTGTFSIDPTQDVLDEGTGESVSVSGSTSANDTVNGATLTITDDDVAPGDIGLTLSSSAVAESASATTITVTAALGGSTRFTTDKAITVAVGASGDGATEGTDYGTVSDFTITLSAGSGSVTGTFSIDPTQDVLDEGTGESVSVYGEHERERHRERRDPDDNGRRRRSGGHRSYAEFKRGGRVCFCYDDNGDGGTRGQHEIYHGQGDNGSRGGERGRGDGGDGLRHGCGFHDNSERWKRERNGDVQHRSYAGRA